jgi:hypothetical protein
MTEIKGIVKSVSSPKEWMGKLQFGFTLKENPKVWYNVAGEQDELNKIMKHIISKGNTIEFNFDQESKEVSNLVMKEKAKEEIESTEDMTSFEDLLSDAHKKFNGNFSIKTEMIQNEWEKQRAIFKAKVDVLGIGVYEAYGDATQENCGEMVKKHYIRMAETRAIARALRWATNNARVAEEETEQGEFPTEEIEKE